MGKDVPEEGVEQDGTGRGDRLGGQEIHHDYRRVDGMMSESYAAADRGSEEHRRGLSQRMSQV